MKEGIMKDYQNPHTENYNYTAKECTKCNARVQFILLNLLESTEKSRRVCYWVSRNLGVLLDLIGLIYPERVLAEIRIAKKGQLEAKSVPRDRAGAWWVCGNTQDRQSVL
jgi:hypothetical protein